MRCAQCGRLHDRKRFCSNKCKDRYHNLHNPRGKYAHLADLSPEGPVYPYEVEWVEEGWDAHKDCY